MDRERQILDIDTREKCQCFLAPLVQQLREVTTDQAPFAVLAFILDAGNVFRLLACWVAQPPGLANFGPVPPPVASPVPLQGYDVPTSLEMLCEQAEELLSLLDLGQVQTEDARSWIHHLQQGVARLGGAQRRATTADEEQALGQLCAHGEVRFLQGFDKQYCQLGRLVPGTGGYKHEEAICLKSMLDWLGYSFAERRPDLARQAQDANRGPEQREPGQILDESLRNVRRQMDPRQGDPPDEALRFIYQDLWHVARYLGRFLDDPEFSDEGRFSTAGSSMDPTAYPASSQRLQSSHGTTMQVSTAAYQHRVHARSSDLQREAEEVKETLPTLRFDTLFHEAAKDGNVHDVEKLLIEARDELNQANDEGDTPLMLAAYFGQKGVVKSLISEAECDLWLKNDQGRTAKQQAQMNNHDDVVDMLQKEELSFRRRTDSRRSNPQRIPGPPEEAIELGHLEDAETKLREEAERNGKKPDFSKALCSAVAHGKLNQCDFWLDKGADIVEGLVSAASSGDRAIVEHFLLKGADVNKGNGLTPLQAAADGGHEAVVELLLQRGADRHAVDSVFEMTALMKACEKGHLAAVKLLAREESDLAARVWEGSTPLIVASASLEPGAVEVVKFLLAKGVDPKITNDKGETAVMKALESDSHEKSEIVVCLLDEGGDLHQMGDEGRMAILKAAEQADLGAVKVLVAQGCDLTVKDDHGNTPLMKAVESAAHWRKFGREDLARDHQEVIEYLLAKGVDLNETNNLGRTVLMQACFNGQLDEVKILLAAEGSHPEADYEDGNTLLKLALDGAQAAGKQEAEAEAQDGSEADRTLMAKFRKEGCLEVIEYLVSRNL